MLIVRRLAAGLFAVCALTVWAPMAAGADAPARLAGQVSDQAGVLGSATAEIDDALARLDADTDLQLFVVFVESFDGIAAQAWADRTALLSDLGDRDALLAVATRDRSYAYVFTDTTLTDAQLDDVARGDIEPALRRGDWAGAVVAAADGYRTAGSSGAGASTLIWAVGILAVVIVGALLWVRERRRRTDPALPPIPHQPGPDSEQAGATDPHPGTSTADLDARANALLIELDDDLRASERELTLATAQYGTAATESFQRALDAARQDVAEAFRLRMVLDEEPTPAEPARRRILAEIIARCETADTRLDAESEAFDRLRDLEGRVEEVAAEVQQRSAAVEAALPAADAALHTIMQRYAGATVTAVSGNVGAARERLVFAAQATERARRAIATPPDPSAPVDPPATVEPSGTVEPSDTVDSSATPGTSSTGAGIPGGGRAEAALAVRAAEQAVDQAEQLVASVHQAGTDLDAARTSVDALLVEVRSELAAGRAALAAGGDRTSLADLSAAVSGAEQTLTAVQAGLSVPTPDPTSAVRRLTDADAALDLAIAEARDAAVRLARSRALLAQALPVARAEVAAAGDFITTRRGAIEGSARASLAEAQRHLILAESKADADPVAALAEAQEAHRLAAAAGRAAHDDVQRWAGPGGAGGGLAGAGWGGGQRGGFDAGSFAGAVLGGILAGGGRSGGSWGGGGFGGSGSRGRRTGGGSGGVRRGGGGRF